MSTLKIAIGVPRFPNLVQTYVLNQIVTLKRAGVDITVVAANRGRYHDDKLPAVFQELSLLQDTLYVPSDGAKFFSALLALPIGMPAYRKALLTLLRSGVARTHGLKYLVKAFVRAKAPALRPFDVFHSHSPFTSYNYLFLREVFDVPLITTYHGKVPRGVPQLNDAHLKQVLAKGDLFLVNTEFARAELADLGCPPHKIQILPQSINVEDFPYRERFVDQTQRIVLLTVARLSVEKGHRVAVEAIARLADRFPTLEYHIVGDGPERQSIVALIERFRLQERVKLLGMKTGEELQKAYADAHLFVLPSINTGDGYLVETQGVVLQEAQASGIPVLGSRTGGIPDVVNDRVTGLLFKEGDSCDLAEKIQHLIQNPEAYRALSRAGRTDVEKRFSNAVIGTRLLETYHKFAMPRQATAVSGY